MSKFDFTKLENLYVVKDINADLGNIPFLTPSRTLSVDDKWVKTIYRLLDGEVAVSLNSTTIDDKPTNQHNHGHAMCVNLGEEFTKAMIELFKVKDKLRGCYDFDRQYYTREFTVDHTFDFEKQSDFAKKILWQNYNVFDDTPYVFSFEKHKMFRMLGYFYDHPIFASINKINDVESNLTLVLGVKRHCYCNLLSSSRKNIKSKVLTAYAYAADMGFESRVERLWYVINQVKKDFLSPIKQQVVDGVICNYVGWSKSPEDNYKTVFHYLCVKDNEIHFVDTFQFPT